ncbi:unnamed protein product [Didymodactylos carnosus]|uniref:Uncharacterized protein n=1 Tax=Didymodactylos carnosus TaxID=1234261 RepID=A0A814FHH3_9BILA|nr:unnamed protein product [Didymodactylos carnosus]CAF3753961.1 unnamed protein product [Didymodactylos carnosus]
MSENASTFKPINSNNNSDSSSLPLISFRLSPSFPNWRINYKPMPQKFQSKGIWAGHQTQDEFMTMHLR